MAENKPPIDPNQGDMFPETIKEGIGTLIEYVPKPQNFLEEGLAI